VRTHKLALAAQRRFWHTILKDTVQFSEVQKALDLLDRAEKQASQVYKRWVLLDSCSMCMSPCRG
jgi:hypothetical protein